MDSLRFRVKSRGTLFGSVVWAIKLVWQSGRALTLANVVVTVMQSVLPVAALYLTKLVVNTVAAGLTAADKTETVRELAFLIIISAGVALLDRALTATAEYVRTAQTYVATDRVYEILHAKSIQIDLEYYENSEYYDALHRAQEEAAYRPTRVLESIFSCAQSGISVVALGGLLLTFHWAIPAVLLVTTLPGLLIRLHFAESFFFWSRNQTAAERRALYFNSLLTRDTHAKEVRLFDLGKIFVDRFGKLRRQIRSEKLSLLKRRSFADLLTQTSTVLPAFGLYGFLAYRAVQGQMTLGDLVLFYQAVQRGQAYVGQFLGSLAVLYENNLFLSNIHEFLALKPKLIDPVRPKTPPESRREGIVFRHVMFRYPNSDRNVLAGIDLHIRPGEHIALVGENGSGKTTLVKLLTRLYDPTDGVVSIDGIDARELSLETVRRKISVVFQDYAKYQLSAKENIWFGDVNAAMDDRRIVGAAQKAGAHNTIASLPRGYDTVLGKWFRDGEELSIGEWQKIALARAFLREAEIIILDEPTSALDPKAEYEVFNKFHQLSLGRTAILISHRLSTVKMADHIYFLENGKIVENGSHDELIDRGGKYACMFETQAQHYK